MSTIVSVQLFIAPGCPHCPGVLQALSELIKAGDIAELNVSNMALVPDKARAMGIRSVPWIKIGPFELTGLHTKGELQTWIHRVGSDSGMRAYLVEQFTSGELKKVIKLVKKDPELLAHFPVLMADKDTPLGAKIGIGAVFEELQGSPLIQPLIPALSELLASEDPSIRNDACYYLGLTESPDAVPSIQALINDPHEEIRETVHDAISIIQDASPPTE